jgi:hypothetical protein
MTSPVALGRLRILRPTLSCRSRLRIHPTNTRPITLWPFSLFKLPMEPSENALGKRPAPAVDGAEPESEAKTARVDESKSPSPDGAAGDGERRGKKPKRAIRGNGKERGLKERRGTRTEPRDETEERGPRLPKRQCALLLGYAGTGYSGMQVYVSCCRSACVPTLIAAQAEGRENDREHALHGARRGRCGIAGQCRRPCQGQPQPRGTDRRGCACRW